MQLDIPRSKPDFHSMRVRSPAKINLHLRVGPLRADGYHPIVSWMTKIGLFDEIEIGPSPDGQVHLTCDRPNLVVDRTNLILRASDTLCYKMEHFWGARVHLMKTIPVGGGLGGGSSNAASALMALNEFWKLNLSKDELAQIGLSIGSDVPFFFYGVSNICKGRGEIVTPTPGPRGYKVLIFPPFGVSTAAVYKKFDEMKQPDFATADTPDWARWAVLPPTELLGNLINDLEPPAFAVCPQLGKMRSDLESKLGRIVRMSGSGSTLFTLFDEPDQATRAVKTVEQLSLNAIFCEDFPDDA